MQGDLIATFQDLKGATEKLERDSTMTCSDRTWNNGYKSKEGKFSLDITKYFFPVRV